MGSLLGVIALRATGLGFLMITLALSQVLWGLAYRMSNVTNGDNGIAGLTRPMPFGISLDSAASFYWFALVVGDAGLPHDGDFCVVVVRIVIERRARPAAPDGRAGLQSLDDPGITFVYAGFWGGVSGLLYVYYNKYSTRPRFSTHEFGRTLLA